MRKQTNPITIIMFDVSILIATMVAILLPPLLERNKPVEKLEERFQELASPVLF